MAKLRQLDPRFFCVLTTTTTTGFQVANSEANAQIEVLYSPLDFWPIMRRAFALIRPVRIILVEAEVWPNLAAEARNRRIPLALVNARLSHRSEARFQRFRFLITPTFRCLDAVCVQEAEDVERWIALGIPRERIHHVGSIKYDPGEVTLPAPPLDLLRSFGFDSSRPILLGGSTHLGEEEILAQIFQRLRGDFADLQLIIAPRHVERASEIRSRLQQLGLRVALRSESPVPNAECLLLNTTGELQSWYGVATIVFMGKSLTARGGQNPVEPILAGKPVLFGPHMENFSTLAHGLIANRGAIQVDGPNTLEEKIAGLLRDPQAAAGLVRNALTVISKHTGATRRTAAIVMQLNSHHGAGELRGTFDRDALQR